MKKKEYNLFDTYLITVFDNKINWVGILKWSTDRVGSDNLDPKSTFTHFIYGDGELINGTLLLHEDNRLTSSEEGGINFFKELQSLPKWSETEYYMTAFRVPYPAIRYCNNGSIVPFDFYLFLLGQLGYKWNPDTDWYEKVNPEEKIAA